MKSSNWVDEEILNLKCFNIIESIDNDLVLTDDFCRALERVFGSQKAAAELLEYEEKEWVYSQIIEGLYRMSYFEKPKSQNEIEKSVTIISRVLDMKAIVKQVKKTKKEILKG